MIRVPPEFEIWFPETQEEAVKMLQRVERAGRICYKSEDKITPDSYIRFISNRIASGHVSIIEHAVMTARIVCDRGISHEIVRHRLASYSMESTRYVNYNKEKFGSHISVVKPDEITGNVEWWEPIWTDAMLKAESSYQELVRLGCPPKIARSVLPTGLKTELVVTANLREWALIFKLRTSTEAHPQIRQLMNMGLAKARQLFTVIFDNI